MRCSISLGIRKILFEIMIRSYFIPIILVNVRKWDKTKFWKKGCEEIDAIGRSIGWYSYSDECSGNSQFKYKAIYPFP